MRFNDFSEQLVPSANIHFMVGSKEVYCCTNSKAGNEIHSLEVLEYRFDISMTGEPIIRVWFDKDSLPDSWLAELSNLDEETDDAPVAEQPIPGANQKLRDVIEDYFAWTVECFDCSKVEMMETMLDILTPEDMELLGLGATMREYLAADDRHDD